MTRREKMNTAVHNHDHGLLSKDEIQQKYDTLAPDYNNAMWVENNVFGVKRLRRKLMVRAASKVLDVACGTGENFPFFQANTTITAIDFSPRMLDMARTRAENLGLSVDCRQMDAETLKFPDHTFDTVVSALSTCTFPDSIIALREMGRVCKAEGRILLLEHGRSKHRLINTFLDRNAASHYAVAGCRWNQEPLDLIQRAGLRIANIQRGFFGVFYAIEAVWG
jgi:ubiquinone/menaquinone biosynthesis C-methylase UbiE